MTRPSVVVTGAPSTSALRGVGVGATVGAAVLLPAVGWGVPTDDACDPVLVAPQPAIQIAQPAAASPINLVVMRTAAG